MKKILSALLVAVAVMAGAPAAQAGGFKFGPKVGLNVNTFSASSDVLSSSNRCGFNAGVGAQFTVPLIGVGADVSVMYVRRSNSVTSPVFDALTNEVTDHITEKANYSYLAIPVHLMYRLDLPAVSSIIAPYVITGPQFAFRLNKDIINNFRSKKTDVCWDFGLGIELIKHLQIGATYSLGINKGVQFLGLTDAEGGKIKGNTNGWTISAAWMF